MKCIVLLVFTAVAALLVSCEPMDAVDPFGLIHDDDKSSSSGGGGQSSSSDRGGQSASVAGVWHGVSASSQVSTTLNLSDNGGAISGSLSWPNDRRTVSGSRSGTSVTLHIGGGDVWHLSISGNHMSGRGDKFGTNRSYNLSFNR